jgi:hypothetical protein
MLDAHPSRAHGDEMTKCLVCGCSEIHTDEVEHRGWVLLAECARCDHRWTARMDPTEPLVARALQSVRPARVAREVASAA